MKSLFKNILKNLLITTSLYALNINTALATEEIDVLFLYEPAVAEHYNGEATTRINHLIQTTNSIYSSSNLNIQIKAAEIQQYDFDDNKGAYELMESAKSSTDIATLRDDLGADLVVIYRLYRQGQPCGLGYRPAAEDGEWLALSYVAIDCASYKTAHEIGHNMGLAHSYAQGSEAFLPYARGHGVEGKFATIMAYGNAYNAPKVYKFSSTEYDCNGESCGVASGEEQADAVRALRKTASIAANLRTQNTQQCSSQDLATFNNIQSTYFNQQDQVSTLLSQLNTQKVASQKAQVQYQQVMLDYVELITVSYQPANTLYQSARADYIKQLAAYREGTINRDAAVTSYYAYKSARETLINEHDKIKTFHATQYLTSYSKLTSANNQLSALKAEYASEQKKIAPLETEYAEAQTIYQCA